MTKLEACPFCGGEAQRFTIGDDEPNNAGGDCIGCTRCGASSHVEFGRKENLVSLWNRRTAMRSATPQAEDGLLNEVRILIIEGSEPRGRNELLQAAIDRIEAALAPQVAAPADEDTAAARDAWVTGTGIMRDGKRIDPADFYAAPADEDAEKLVERLRRHADAHEWFVSALTEHYNRMAEKTGSDPLPERARQSDHAPVMREAADIIERLASKGADEDALRAALSAAIAQKLDTQEHGGLTEYGEGGLASLRSLALDFAYIDSRAALPVPQPGDA